MLDVAGARGFVGGGDALAEDPANLVDEEVKGVAFAAGNVGQAAAGVGVKVRSRVGS